MDDQQDPPVDSDAEEDLDVDEVDGDEPVEVEDDLVEERADDDLDGEDQLEAAEQDETAPTSDRPVAEAGDGFLTYEVSEWSGESRALLDAMLTSAGVRHFWQGTALSVDADREDDVDRIIDEVLASATASLDPDRDKCVYEVGEWSAAMQQSLADSLVVAEIPYEWDERGDLVVYADDEEAVDAILDAMPDPDDADRVDGEEVDVQEALSSLWSSVGQLAKNPKTPSAVVTVAELADTLEHTPLPFGFEPPIWRAIVEAATALRDGLSAVDDEDLWDDDRIIEAAADLRDRIRPYL